MKMKRVLSICLILMVLTTVFATVPVYAEQWQQYGDDWQYINDKGDPVTGWWKINGKWYFFDEYGWMLRDEIYDTGSKAYYLASNGAMQTGWIKNVCGYGADSWTEWYYADTDGALANGWKKIGGIWYWFENYLMVSGGSYKINNKLYVFQNNGALVSKAGWINTKYDGWLYANADGTPVTGWKKINGKWYYFTPEWGNMVTGARSINGVLYKFDDNGVWVDTITKTGWQKIKGEWYYLDSNGKAVTGWKMISGIWYYFYPVDGSMAYGCALEINGKFYFFNTNGSLVSKEGWYKEVLGGITWWYYVYSNGVCIRKAWKNIGGNWYYFDENAVMVDWDYMEINNKAYSFNPNGTMRTGWIQLWGSWYYADPVSGAFVKGSQKINGVWYEFDEDGYYLIG